MHIDIATSKQNGHVYTRALLRETYRGNGKVKHRTIANLSRCTSEDLSVELPL